MARSRAMESREPGQIRKEAALSGLLHAPRNSLAGAKSRLTRLGARSRRRVHGPLVSAAASSRARRAPTTRWRPRGLKPGRLARDLEPLRVARVEHELLLDHVGLRARRTGRGAARSSCAETKSVRARGRGTRRGSAPAGGSARTPGAQRSSSGFGGVDSRQVAQVVLDLAAQLDAVAQAVEAVGLVGDRRADERDQQHGGAADPHAPAGRRAGGRASPAPRSRRRCTASPPAGTGSARAATGPRSRSPRTRGRRAPPARRARARARAQSAARGRSRPCRPPAAPSAGSRRAGAASPRARSRCPAGGRASRPCRA